MESKDIKYPSSRSLRRFQARQEKQAKMKKTLLILVKEAAFSDSLRAVAVAMELNGTLVSSLEMMIRGDRNFTLLSGVYGALQSYDQTIMVPVDEIVVVAPPAIFDSSKGEGIYLELKRRAHQVKTKRFLWGHGDLKKLVQNNLNKILVS